MLTTLLLTSALALNGISTAPGTPIKNEGIQGYVPTEQVALSRSKFQDDKFGIFIHWGVYSMVGHGEWVMSEENINYKDYSILPGGFYPGSFNAQEWVSAIKAAGAKYITITTRHHDGFSMFDTKASTYDIMDASPFKRDIIKELADECHKQGITINFYYSLVDWGRDDYPTGYYSGQGLDKDPSKADFNHYVDFMCEQITELLTNYGKVGCIWFDGDWDHLLKPEPGQETVVDFDWQYGRIYELIHKLQPECLVGNNHHRIPIPGEDIQIFERDVPGENAAGYSRTSTVSNELALETCKTMNKTWGYSLSDHNYKSKEEIVRLIISTAGRNANLLLNIGPRPDGRIPTEALERFSQIGEWLSANGDAIYGTRATLMRPQDWGVVTHKDDKIFLHVTERPADGTITLPFALKVKSVGHFGGGEPIVSKRAKNSFTVTVPEDADCSLDYIIEIVTK